MGGAASKYSGRTKADDVATDVDIAGKSVVITGGNTGIGLHTARVLAERGASVIIACRSRERGEAALAKLPEGVELMQLDLSDFGSIKSFADEFKAKERPLHLLLNNAGIMMLPKFQVTADGIEKQWGVNHLGHFYLTSLLMDKLRESAPSRVVCVASEAHKASHKKGNCVSPLPEEKAKSYSSIAAYGDSKMSNILHARELNRRETEAKTGVTAYSLHPGVIPTELGRNSGMANFFYTFGKMFMKSIPQGAATTVFCALESTTPGQYHMDCAPATSSRAEVVDDALAAQLWDNSEKLVEEILAKRAQGAEEADQPKAAL